MKQFLLFVFSLSILSTAMNAQTPGCAGAVDLNLNPVFSGGGSPEDPTINYGCVTATNQHIWYGYFKVCQGGTLSLGANTASSGNDVDIVVWGPFTTTNNICQNLTALNVFGCANTTSYTETVAMGTVGTSEIYMVALVCDTNLVIPNFQMSGTAQVDITCSSMFPCFPTSGIEVPCLVTVDSLTQEYKMVWQEYPANPVSYFGILKTDAMGNPVQIDTVHVTSLSEYIDTSADPNVHTEQYALVTYDTCGSGWQSAGAYIQPVFCQSSLSTQNTVNISWTPYVDNAAGNGPMYYVIYRGPSFSNMTVLDTVATFINNYTDVSPLSGTSYYKIGVGMFAPCVPMRLQQPTSVFSYPVQSFSNAAPITVVGIEENSLSNVSLFPNPSNGIITVNNLQQQSTLRVYDISGRLVREEALDQSASQQVDLGSLEQGMYSVTIENESGYYRKEIVIQH